jgi:hypothetical protein
MITLIANVIAEVFPVTLAEACAYVRVREILTITISAKLRQSLQMIFGILKNPSRVFTKMLGNLNISLYGTITLSFDRRFYSTIRVDGIE